MSRTVLTLEDTGYAVKTTPPIHGEIRQIRWRNASGDTGGSFELSLQPLAPGGDTGEGFVFMSSDLTPNFVKVPSQRTHDINGSDTGTPVSTSPAPIVASGDHIRAVFSPGATANGRLYIWHGE